MANGKEFRRRFTPGGDPGPKRKLTVGRAFWVCGSGLYCVARCGECRAAGVGAAGPLQVVIADFPLGTLVNRVG